jgi:hypothetical protein
MRAGNMRCPDAYVGAHRRPSGKAPPSVFVDGPRQACAFRPSGGSLRCSAHRTVPQPLSREVPVAHDATAATGAKSGGQTRYWAECVLSRTTSAAGRACAISRMAFS